MCLCVCDVFYSCCETTAQSHPLCVECRVKAEVWSRSFSLKYLLLFFLVLSNFLVFGADVLSTVTTFVDVYLILITFWCFIDMLRWPLDTDRWRKLVTDITESPFILTRVKGHQTHMLTCHWQVQLMLTCHTDILLTLTCSIDVQLMLMFTDMRWDNRCADVRGDISRPLRRLFPRACDWRKISLSGATCGVVMVEPTTAGTGGVCRGSRGDRHPPHAWWGPR